MKKIAIYCGSSKGFDSIYATTAQSVGEYLAKNEMTLIYGAGSVGLMGIIADSVLENGGEAIGIIPQFLMDLEVGHKNLTEMYITQSMHERKMKMCELSDGIIALPGGFGTLDELFEMLTWSQLGLHEMPIGLLNTNGFFDSILAMIDKMVVEGFLKKQNQDLLIVENDIENLILKMKSTERPKALKWLGRS
ncbi:MAG: TIGR00730 family Rossman fold protein [Bacteroidota bacterium]